MEEYTALMLLDHHEDIAGICTQPMRIDFSDGSAHFPDLFIVHTDGRQSLGNVRPETLIDDDAIEQFRKTAELCAAIGWTHRVLTGIQLPHRNNLELLAAHRHPRHEPTDELAEMFLRIAEEAAPFGQLWNASHRIPGPTGLAGLYNLMWHRELVFDMDHPLELNTLVWRP